MPPSSRVCVDDGKSWIGTGVGHLIFLKLMAQFHDVAPHRHAYRSRVSCHLDTGTNPLKCPGPQGMLDGMLGMDLP